MSSKNRSKETTHAVRIIKIIRRLLNFRATTIEELQTIFGVSRRTIYNDLGAIKEAKLGLCSFKGDDGRSYYRIHLYEQKSKMELKVGHLVTVGFLTNMLPYFGGTPFFDEISELFRTILSAEDDHNPLLLRLQRKLVIFPPMLKDKIKTIPFFTEILNALLHERQVKLCYTHDERSKKMLHLEPLSLIVNHGAWYLLGIIKGAGCYCSLDIKKIIECRCLKDRCSSYPANYSPLDFVNLQDDALRESSLVKIND